jgi:hypothetical protein
MHMDWFTNVIRRHPFSVFGLDENGEGAGDEDLNAVCKR